MMQGRDRVAPGKTSLSAYGKTDPGIAGARL
jgi:hypothetical protein